MVLLEGFDIEVDVYNVLERESVFRAFGGQSSEDYLIVVGGPFLVRYGCKESGNYIIGCLSTLFSV